MKLGAVGRLESVKSSCSWERWHEWMSKTNAGMNISNRSGPSFNRGLNITVI